MTRAPADPINAPAHYQAVCHCPNCGHAIEAISITERFSFVVGNGLKYLLRAGRKDGSDAAQDYGKAAWYATRAAEHARSATERAATAPQAAFPAPHTGQPTPGVWERNSYTELHERLVGPIHDTRDGALFPSGWTPEMEERAVRGGET